MIRITKNSLPPSPALDGSFSVGTIANICLAILASDLFIDVIGKHERTPSGNRRRDSPAEYVRG